MLMTRTYKAFHIRLATQLSAQMTLQMKPQQTVPVRLGQTQIGGMEMCVSPWIIVFHHMMLQIQILGGLFQIKLLLSDRIQAAHHRRTHQLRRCRDTNDNRRCGQMRTTSAFRIEYLPPLSQMALPRLMENLLKRTILVQSGVVGFVYAACVFSLVAFYRVLSEPPPPHACAI